LKLKSEFRKNFYLIFKNCASDLITTYFIIYEINIRCDDLLNDLLTALYNGSLSLQLLSTLGNQSLMSLDDIASYREEHRRPLVGTIGDFSVMVPGAPSGGPLLLAVLGILGTPQDNPSWWQPDTPARNLQRVAETLRLSALYHAQLGEEMLRRKIFI
jgi:gamma-glutamyltranspeptidase